MLLRSGHEAWLTFAASTMIGLAACSNKSEGSGTSVTTVDDFARFWADCSEYCQKDESCGIKSAAACAAWCAPADLTKAAIVSAGLAPEDLRRCQDAQRLSDTCHLGLSCDQLNMLMTPCDLQTTAAHTNCSLIVSALDLYARTHATTPLFGSFDGTFAGSDRGSLSGWITSWATTTWSGIGATIGFIDGAGTVTGSTLTLSGRGKDANGTATITFTGTLKGAAGADAGAGAYTGEGSWQSSLGGEGTFEIKSN